MAAFLGSFIVRNEIGVAAEEGGTCLNIHETLRGNEETKTILQQVIDSLSAQVFHYFVDITSSEAAELVESGAILDMVELQKTKAKLRDKYISEAARGVFAAYSENALLCVPIVIFKVFKIIFEIMVFRFRCNRFEICHGFWPAIR
jgi:hypothetical protein